MLCIPFGLTQAIKQVNMQIATIVYKIQTANKCVPIRACALRQNSLAKFLLHVAGKDCDTICQMEFNYELNGVNIEGQVQHA